MVILNGDKTNVALRFIIYNDLVFIDFLITISALNSCQINHKIPQLKTYIDDYFMSPPYM
jgi:hypothetical protein